MSEEENIPALTSSDDVSVLRVLLHTIQGSSPISTTEYIVTPDEE